MGQQYMQKLLETSLNVCRHTIAHLLSEKKYIRVAKEFEQCLTSLTFPAAVLLQSFKYSEDIVMFCLFINCVIIRS